MGPGPQQEQEQKQTGPGLANQSWVYYLRALSCPLSPLPLSPHHPRLHRSTLSLSPQLHLVLSVNTNLRPGVNSLLKQTEKFIPCAQSRGGVVVCVCVCVGRCDAWVVCVYWAWGLCPFPSGLPAYRRRLGNACLSMKETLFRPCKIPT